jgi:alkylated DNA nucleotide flippase Atl1
VGWALKALPDAMSEAVPWHRVVGAAGRISFREGPGPLVQRRLLAAEGVAFASGRVDLSVHGFGASRPPRPARRARRGAASGAPERGER